MKTIMNKNIENINRQMNNTLELMLKKGYVLFYNQPKLEEINNESKISWNNHKSCREISSKYFLKIDQYLKIVSDDAYLAMLNDYSVIRCSFTFRDNKLISQNMLWWPCPFLIDSAMYNEFGLIETIECLLEDKKIKNSIIMRSPIRVDFDSSNDKTEHPRAHVHMQNENSRINTKKPICFNRFINYIVKCYYPQWKIDFKNSDYLNFQFEKQSRTMDYYNKTEIIFE